MQVKNGIGGGLAILIFLLVYLNPFILIGSTLIDFSEAQKINPALLSDPLWKQYTLLVWGCVVTFGVVLIYTGLKLKKGVGNPDAVYFAVLAILAVSILMPFLTQELLVQYVYGKSSGNYYGMVVRNLIFSFSWSFYLLKSERSKNTYKI